MGSSSPCTCNARVCNYHKENGYGFDTEKAVISGSTQLAALSKTLTSFMSPNDSPVEYLNTNGTNPSKKAINALRNSIASVSPMQGLSLQPFCIDLTTSYEEKETYSAKEGYTSIKPASHMCSVIVCIIIGIILFGFACYIVYSYVSCPCRKKHENDLRETQANKDELSN